MCVTGPWGFRMDWYSGVELFTVAALGSLGGLLLLTTLPLKRDAADTSIFTTVAEQTVFLFDGNVLVDCSPDGRGLLATSAIPGGPLPKLMGYLVQHFTDVEAHLLRLPVEGRITIASKDTDTHPLLLMAELCNGLMRITLRPAETPGAQNGPEQMAFLAQREELAALRQTVSQAPLLVWREGQDGQVIWANAAYLNHVTLQLGPDQDLVWPLPRLFDRTAAAQGIVGQRQRLVLGDTSFWFDLTSVTDGAARLVYALPADAVVQAETSLGEFMQTLTKTFAHLPIGLAVFDRQRHLQLFNPALLDLTDLSAEFLISRPTMLAVLDAMRERSMIPEPRDYRLWRRQIVEMERAAASSQFHDTWSLPGGQTYRVTGWPHPNGALALMLEDISTEISRTRRYRAELELGQAVIDTMDAAIAVFSHSGQLLLTNSAYAKFWGHDPAEQIADGVIGAVSDYWRNNSAPSPIWDDVEAFIARLGNREPWAGEARLSDGRLITCHFTPLTGGATLAAFRTAPSNGGRKPRLAQTPAQRSA
jgi:PAS domain-containing protein